MNVFQQAKNFFTKQSEIKRAFAFFVILLCLVFFRVVINRQTFFSDVLGQPLSTGSPYYDGPKTFWELDSTNYMHFEVPETIYWAQQLREGHFAFWTPLQGNGQPLSATITSGMYNPIKLLLFGIFPYWKTFDFYILLRFLIAGFGTYLFLKKINVSHQAALLGGVAYMFSSYFALWITHWSINADMMIPYILLGIESLIASTRAKNVILLGIAWTTMVLSNNPESVITITIFSLAYFIFKFVREKGSVHIVRAFGFSIFIAFALCLPLLWDVILFVSQSMNQHNAEWTGAHLNEHGNILLQIGRFFHLPVSPSLFAEFTMVFGVGKESLLPTYIGTFLLLFTIAALSGARKKEYTFAPAFFGGVVLFFLFIWLGIPPISWLQRLPLLVQVNFFRYIGTFYFCLAILAAIGFENIKNQVVNLKRFQNIVFWTFVPTVGFFFLSSWFRESYKLAFAPADVTKIEFYLKKFPSAIQTVTLWFVHNPYSYAFFVCFTTLFFGLLFWFLWRKKAYTVMFVVLILELVLYMPKTRDLSNFQNPYREPPFVTYLKARPDIDSYRMFAVDRTLMSQVAMGYGLRDMGTFDGFFLQSYLAYLEPFFTSGFVRAPSELYKMGTAEEMNNKSFLPIFNLASVKYIVSEKPFPKDASYKLIYDKEVKIYENEGALPLARIETSGGAISNTVTIIAEEPNRVTLKTWNAPVGTLILAETNYPGWRAFVDGKEQAIETVHTMFRGVHIPAGNHEIIFTYWPFTSNTLRAIFHST